MAREDEEPLELKIDIPENLVTTLQKDYCIYSVPPTLRKVNPEAYTPQVIAIGPIHRKRENLQLMHVQKLRYFKEFCERKSSNDCKEFGNELLRQIDVDKMRKCYAESFECCSNTFLNMILLDSVFIIELFIRHKNSLNYENDFIIGQPWLSTDVQQDLILIENQLPFKILNDLYNFADFTKSSGRDEYPNTFLELTCNYFENITPKNVKTEYPKDALHFTDLVRQFWIHNHPNMPKGQCTKSLYSISKLHKAGLNLKPASDKNYLEIQFKPGGFCSRAALEIPCFEIDDTTEMVVRNLMAFEQCHCPFETYVCSYIRLLDFLVDTGEDVELLVDKKILFNGLGNNATVANIVNKLCNQIAEVNSCYCPMADQMNKFYESFFNNTMAILKGTYFGDIWRGTGTSAAIFLLLLTMIQALCAIQQVQDEKSSKC